MPYLGDDVIYEQPLIASSKTFKDNIHNVGDFHLAAADDQSSNKQRQGI